MASDPITSWQIKGVKLETVTELFSWPPKLLWMATAAMKLKDACSLEGKLPGINPGILLKNRELTFLTKVCLVKAMVSPVVMYGCQSWITAELMLSNCSAGEDS